jgi:hypothetical protein
MTSSSAVFRAEGRAVVGDGDDVARRATLERPGTFGPERCGWARVDGLIETG